MNTELVEPILWGIAHPHTALTEEELAQVRADLELAEPKKCTLRYGTLDGARETEECGQPAIQERLFACGHTSYLCVMHVSNLDASNPAPNPAHWWQCRKCGFVGPFEQHMVTAVPL